MFEADGFVAANSEFQKFWRVLGVLPGGVAPGKLIGRGMRADKRK